jgi:hypothetical protein
VLMLVVRCRRTIAIHIRDAIVRVAVTVIGRVGARSQMRNTTQQCGLVETRAKTRVTD